MTQYLGMVPQEVRELSGQFTNSAEQIRQLVNGLTARLNGATWTGPDRERFINDWNGQYVPQLNAVAAALDSASQRALHNAIEQENVSL